MTQPTTVLWNAHASALIRSGDTLILTDPWYGVAFSSWVPWPPPVLNPDVLIGLAGAGRLAVVISHGHGDHYDAEFVAKLPPGTAIYVPKFRDGHMKDLIPQAVELDADGAWIGKCIVRAFEAAHSAMISIEAPDAVVFHGNDVYTLPQDQIDRINFLMAHHSDRPRLLMGQGGSASGWPLRYRYPEKDRQAKAVQKAVGILHSLYDLGHKLQAQRILGYACFARAQFAGETWLPRNCTGRYANAICETDRFLHMQPGDLYVPAEDRLIAMAPTLETDAYPVLPMPGFPDDWDKQRTRMRAFMIGAGMIAQIHGLSFIVVVDDAEWWPFGSFDLSRVKYCHVSRAVMAGVLAGRIPFTDLMTGYLAEWERHPDEPNIEFLTELEVYGFQWQEQVTRGAAA